MRLSTSVKLFWLLNAATTALLLEDNVDLVDFSLRLQLLDLEKVFGKRECGFARVLLVLPFFVQQYAAERDRDGGLCVF